MNIIYLARVMKIIMFLTIAGLLTVSASSYSQRITLKGVNIPLSKVVEVIRQQTGYTVFTSKSLLEEAHTVTIDTESIALMDLLKKITAGRPINYQLEDKTISLSRKTTPDRIVSPDSRTESFQQREVTGVVRHAETSELLEGVTVRVKGGRSVGSTNAEGRFRFTIPAGSGNPILVFSYIGMKALEVEYPGQSMQVLLQPSADAIKDVVVTGIYQRERESFTGSSVTYTAQDLQRIGNTNILQSLKTIDPSFAMIENNLFGSDPNRLPDIEIRGKSSIIGLTDEFSSNPNQPLFILDGFESTLAIISDLSMDRVESITLLKDAAAAAIYGSKAANGVVVIETRRPTPGKLRVNYTLNGNVGFADLTDYNLMNSREKLEFELLSSFYGLLNADGKIVPGANLANEARYFERLKEVERGVDTYWASEPLRTALTQRHTLFAEGGDASLRYSVSFNHGITNGVMKGSDRHVTNGNVRLLYRNGNFSVNNSLSIDNVVANKEPTAFSDFSRANPYHRKYDANGNVNMVLEDFRVTASPFNPVYSPLYNDHNLNMNSAGTLGFTNNFEMEWRIMPELRARGRFGLRNIAVHDKVFRSPFNTEFIATDPLQRGRYTEANGKNINYDGDASLTYGKLFADKHMLNVVAGMRMEEAARWRSTYQVQGFIDDEFFNPNFALGYEVGQRAGYTESKRRGASFFMNMGYGYDQRYLMDATLRSDGSSVYGSERQFSNIWSIGLAWNAHNETSLKAVEWLNQLRVRGSIGNPGNQNFDDYISMRIYRYNNDNRNPFGASTIIDNMGNDNLRWQTTLDRNVGVDLRVFKNRLRFTGDYFVKTTDPLLVFVTLPSSTGVKQVAQNMGAQETKGFTLSSEYAVIQNERVNWRVSLNMRQLKSKYQNIGNQLNSSNEANKSRNLIRYYDGGSPSDLWAVRSAGIDPATGREIFINKNGEQTFTHSFQDEVVVGNTEPTLDGVLGNTFSYRGLSVSAYIRYRVGGQAFMQTLFDKVENISTRGVALNQDKRALYDRWKQPGDEAKFKAISRTEQTPISSRFVADNDMIVGESFSIAYESMNAAWLKSVRASSVTFRVYMNDIFHISTIKNERGIDYPFARSVSFSAAVRF